MNSDPDMSPQQMLFLGVAMNRPEQAKAGLEQGADPEAVLENGRTLATEAVLGGTGAPAALRVLVEYGVDLKRADANGMTPWVACLSRGNDRVVADEMAEIRDILEKANACVGERTFEDLEEAAAAGDMEKVRHMVEEEDVPARTPDPFDPVGVAAITNQVEIARYLLEKGGSPNGVDGGMSSLMNAASRGYFDMVRLLVEHGADVDFHLDGAPEWTAALFAHKEGHAEIAEWLGARQAQAEPETVPESARPGGPLEKFADLYRQGVNGINVDLETDDIVQKLAVWDEKHGVHVVDTAHDRLTLQFERLPEDLVAFANEIADFCPDIIEQGFGTMAEFLGDGDSLPDDLRQLVDGLDPDDEAFGVQALARWLKQHQAVELWWD